jgi:hypothetical protein
MTKKPDLTIVSAETTSNSPPRKLGPHGMGLWNRVVGAYRIEDVGGVELLAQACAGEDRAEMLAEAVERDGAVVYSRTGVPKTHPAIKDELAARAFVVRTLDRLGINYEAVQASPGRPGRGVGISWEDIRRGHQEDPAYTKSH